MTNKIQWELMQIKEFELDKPNSFDEGILHFQNVYFHYFKYLEISRNSQRKSILEIGPANFPALAFCYNYQKSYIIEPMKSPHLHDCIYEKNIILFSCPAEDVHFPQTDEIWLLNVLQHTINPELILKTAIKTTKNIRFFEPINQGISGPHFHNLTLEFFEDIFKQKINHFPKHQEITGFHNEECAYGIIKIIQ